MITTLIEAVMRPNKGSDCGVYTYSFFKQTEGWLLLFFNYMVQTRAS